jgi:hypothetical protein
LDILAHSAVIFLETVVHVKGEIELGGCAVGEHIIPATMWESAIIFQKLQRSGK